MFIGNFIDTAEWRSSYVELNLEILKCTGIPVCFPQIVELVSVLHNAIASFPVCLNICLYFAQIE